MGYSTVVTEDLLSIHRVLGSVSGVTKGGKGEGGAAADAEFLRKGLVIFFLQGIHSRDTHIWKVKPSVSVCRWKQKKTAETLTLVSDKIDFNKYKKRPRKPLYTDKKSKFTEGIEQP